MKHHDGDIRHDSPLGVAKRDIKKGEILYVEITCKDGEQRLESEAINFGKKAIQEYMNEEESNGVASVYNGSV